MNRWTLKIEIFYANPLPFLRPYMNKHLGPHSEKITYIVQKGSPAKGVWRNSDEKSQRSARKGDQKVIKNEKCYRTPFADLLLRPPFRKGHSHCPISENFNLNPIDITVTGHIISAELIRAVIACPPSRLGVFK